MGGVALSVERLPVLSPLSDRGAEGIASPDVQLFIMDVELFGPGLSKSIPCLRIIKELVRKMEKKGRRNNVLLFLEMIRQIHTRLTY